MGRQIVCLILSFFLFAAVALGSAIVPGSSWRDMASAVAAPLSREVLTTVDPESRATIRLYDGSWAILIGINSYRYASGLEYAVSDVEAIKKLLVEDLGFRQDRVITLLNENATREKILSTLGSLDKTGENDRVIIYFAGHGTQIALPGGGEMGFLIPFDARIDDRASLLSTGISMQTLKDLSYYIPAKHVLFLVDACYGGLAAVNNRSLALTTKRYLKKITAARARQILTAGGKGEQVIEKAEWGHSAFAYKLLDGLKKGLADVNGDGIVSASELAGWLKPNVSAASDNRQIPQFRAFTEDEGDFVFVLPQEPETVVHKQQATRPVSSRPAPPSSPSPPTMSGPEESSQPAPPESPGEEPLRPPSTPSALPWLEPAGKGKVARAWTGIYLQELTPELASALGATQGVVVRELFRGSPGEKAGILPGDVIMACNDETVISPAQLGKKVSGIPVGESLTLKILRKGEEKLFQVKTQQFPGDVPLSQSPAVPSAPLTSRPSPQESHEFLPATVVSLNLNKSSPDQTYWRMVLETPEGKQMTLGRWFSQNDPTPQVSLGQGVKCKPDLSKGEVVLLDEKGKEFEFGLESASPSSPAGTPPAGGSSAVAPGGSSAAGTPPSAGPSGMASAAPAVAENPPGPLITGKGKVRFFIVKAEKIPPKKPDGSSWRLGGEPPSPMVRIYINGEEKSRTKHVRNVVEKVEWNQMLEEEVDADHDEIALEVLNRHDPVLFVRLMSDDLMGKIILPRGKLTAGRQTLTLDDGILLTVEISKP